MDITLTYKKTIMEPIRVKDLAEIANKLVKDGYGERKIMLSDDEELNGVHEAWEGFSLLGEDSLEWLDFPHYIDDNDIINDYILLS